MWIERIGKKQLFFKSLLGLHKQVLLVRGARQVGKTSFILDCMNGLTEYPQLKINLLYPRSFTVDGIEYLGRDFFGSAPTGENFLKNIEQNVGHLKKLEKPLLVFIDEVDRYPLAMESVQTLAEFSAQIKFVFTGSNLENMVVKNAATGRKKYFDLYPITFSDFLHNMKDATLMQYFEQCSLRKVPESDFYHHKLESLLNIYIRLGGMPRIVSAYFDPQAESQTVSDIIKDLAVSIEENVKTILGEKAKLYEYEDVLRKLAFHSMNTLKFSRLQVQHAGRSEAKRLVFKTVGARVAHKIRLWESENDLSKYIIFDCGLVNYLMNGSHLLEQNIPEKNMAILFETFVGNELIAQMSSRDDLFYWKSGNRAEVEYLLRFPHLAGIDVKTNRGDNKSLNSLALLEPNTSLLIKICAAKLALDREYVAKLPNDKRQKKIALVQIPHYLTSRMMNLLAEV